MSQVTLQQAFDLAIQHQNAGRLREAEAIYEQILSAQPDHLAALQNLGFIAYQSGRAAIAAELLRRAVVLRPHDAGLLSNLGSVLVGAGQVQAAVDAFQRALALMPDSPQIHSNLGNALVAIGQTEQAIASYRQALILNPHSADAHNNLGTALSGLGRRDEAIVEFRQAVALRTQFVQAWNNLGTAFREVGDLDESIAACRQALAAGPQFLPAYHNLGNTFRDAGELDEAIACYRAATKTNHNVAAADDLLLALLLHPNLTPDQVWTEHSRWNEVYARPLAGAIAVHPEPVAAGPQRRLRIGYVSPDFREHPVGCFFLPLIANHDRDGFEILCYSDAGQADQLTEQLRSNATHWRDVHGLPDEQLASLIRQDQIDILVDLTMHTKNNRLLVFARKPATVQVTYLAYPGTTGLETMDYRLTDSFLDPPDQDDRFYSEKSVRLPRTFWCYVPPAHAPAVNPLPAAAAGRITFGCLNLYCKVTSAMLALWATILRETPASRLMVHSYCGRHRGRALGVLAAEGIERERLQFVDRVSPADYFKLYHQIDIALDTHPYPGGTTTCDALWMGVPVVTLAGTTALSRGGLSILSNVGMPELAARDPQQYVRIAVDLAADLPRLASLRATLRDRMAGSPLMDATAFARHVEAAYRRMWFDWSATR
jgi:predicted O-linked N-acetylglucosamine transferase (SPINDLY family)